MSDEAEQKLSLTQRVAIDYWGQDEKSGFREEVREALIQHAEMYVVFKVIKWGVTYLIGPAGLLFLLTELLAWIKNGT